jgi:hypothetical protein
MRQLLGAVILPREGPISQAGLGAEQFLYVPRAEHMGQRIFQHGAEEIITHYFSIATPILRFFSGARQSRETRCREPTGRERKGTQRGSWWLPA